MRGIGRLRRVARRLANRFETRAIILLYHRVNDIALDPQLLCVGRRHFAEHLEVLQKRCHPIQLKALHQTLRDGSRGRCRVIVTFDDGYADNLHNAKPLLERFDVPTTVFVASGYIGSQKGFWKDILEQVLLQPGTVPESLHLSIAGTFHQWELGEAVCYSVEASKRYSRWNVTNPGDPTMRQHLYRSLCALLRPLTADQRGKVLEELLAWAGMESNDFSVHGTLSADEVVQLTNGGLVEVGAHTVSHPVLSLLTAAKQRDEIEGSKHHLENILGHAVTSFAYPYGGRSHYTAETVANVRRAGFQFACSNFDGIVRRGSDMWQLPRFLVRDWDGDEFARRLREWSGF